MVSEDSRLYFMENYKKIQKEREDKIKKELIEEFGKIIDKCYQSSKGYSIYEYKLRLIESLIKLEEEKK